MAEDTVRRPLCDCHGTPMHRNGYDPEGRQHWCCSVKQGARRRVADRDRYQRRKDSGLCARCGGPLLSESLCWDCLNRLEAQRGIRF